MTDLHRLGWSGRSVGEVLEQRVKTLLELHQTGNPAAAELLRATGCARGTVDEILEAELTLDTARMAIARDHHFGDWTRAIARAADAVDPDFEAAASAIPAGDLARLTALLDARLELIHARSAFGHHATLLHHIAANGIEVVRQWQSPPNAVDIARLLLARGADPDAVCDAYTGGPTQTPLCLLVSSSHPARAGVQAALVEALCEGGARANGLQDDGVPLKTAISFGYTAAAEALVRCGARVDNVVFAAAVGDLDRVQNYFASNDARFVEHELEYALIAASGHGRKNVVEFLLRRRPDLNLNVADPVFGATAIGAARYHRRTAVLELLEAHARTAAG